MGATHPFRQDLKVTAWDDVLSASSVDSFRHQLKTFLFQKPVARTSADLVVVPTLD